MYLICGKSEAMERMQHSDVKTTSSVKKVTYALGIRHAPGFWVSKYKSVKLGILTVDEV